MAIRSFPPLNLCSIGQKLIKTLANYGLARWLPPLKPDDGPFLIELPMSSQTVLTIQIFGRGYLTITVDGGAPGEASTLVHTLLIP